MDAHLHDPRTAPRSWSTWLWNAACLVAIAAAALLLGGCAQGLDPVAASGSAEVDAAPADAASQDEPLASDGYLPSLSAQVFGRCWTATADEVGSWTTWQGGDYVPCSDEHTTFTFAAEDLPDDVFDAMRSTHSDAADAALQVRIDDAARDICAPQFADLFPRLTERQVLVNWFSFLPSEAEVDAGAKWVRCDVGVYAVGGAGDDMELSALPQSIHDLVLATYSSPGDYEYCSWAPTSSTDEGPRATEGGHATVCDETARWIFDGLQPLNYPLEAPYPGDSAAIAAAREACDAASRLRGEADDPPGWIYYPTAENWADGARTVSCWSTIG
jgi:hypothetical protein